MKVRIAFIAFLILSVSGLFYYNQTHRVGGSAYDSMVYAIVLIFVVTFVIGLYIAYEFYRIMHSEMKEQVERLTASENDLQTSYDSVSMLMLELNGESRILNTNKAFCDFSGKKRSLIIGKHLDDVLGFDKSAILGIEEVVGLTFRNNQNEKAEI